MSKTWLLTTGIILMTIARSGAQMEYARGKGSIGAATRLIKRPDVKLVEGKTKQDTYYSLAHFNSENAMHQKRALVLYPGLPIVEDRNGAGIRAGQGNNNMGRPSAANLLPEPTAKIPALTKIECGLGDNDGLSIGLGGNACLDLDFDGYFSSRSDTAGDTVNDIVKAASDHEVSMGVVFVIR